jgi:hypothetical protein
MSTTNAGYSQGRTAPAMLTKEQGHRYKWLVDGKIYYQNGAGLSNDWVLADAAVIPPVPPVTPPLDEVLTAGNTSGGNNIQMTGTDQIQWDGTGAGTIIVNEYTAGFTGYDLTVQAGGSNFGGFNILGTGGNLTLQGGTGVDAAGNGHGSVNLIGAAATVGNGGDINITAGNATSGTAGAITITPGAATTGSPGYIDIQLTNGQNGMLIGTGDGTDLGLALVAFNAGTYDLAIGDINGNTGFTMAYFDNNEAANTNYILANDGTTAGVVQWTDITTLVGGATILSEQTTDAASTELLVGGFGGTRISVGNNTMYSFVITVTAMASAGDGTGAVWSHRYTGVIKNIEGTTALVGSVTEETIAEDGSAVSWTGAVTADDANDALTVDVTGQASHTIEWSANVELTENSY